jgi:protein-S-isoprenylcysteine O-methyltransferase Ste14
MPKDIAKPLGLSIVLAGMSLVVCAATHIREAFLGEVEPRLEGLVESGPYRFVRHPVYLGMTIALTDVPISLLSWPGLIGVFLLFLPSEVYRARLEEKALLLKFGEKWKGYASRTGFILPFIGRE